MNSLVNRLRRLLAYMALPLFRWSVPGWRRLCTPLGLSMGQDALWGNVSDKICRGKPHGYRMILKMGDWCDRITYFLGRYDSPELHAILQTALKPGDTFVDIGANIGMVTLTAARAVGPEGKIFAFEPQPTTVLRLRQVLDLNGLKNVTVFPVGVGDSDTVLPLQSIEQSSVWSSFSPRSEVPGLTYKTTHVPIRRADDVLPKDLGPRTVIKIDAEGFECRVIDGMPDCLAHYPAVITELEPELLKSAGSSTQDLWVRMEKAGYQPFLCELKGSRVRLSSASMGIFHSASRDVLWLHPKSPYMAELLKEHTHHSGLRRLTDGMVRLTHRLQADEWPVVGSWIRTGGRRWNQWIYSDGIPARVDGKVELKLSPRAFSGGAYHFDPKLTEEIRQLARPGKGFIDAGAHVGICSLLYSVLAGPESFVVAFEPNPNVFPLLKENVRVSGRPISPLAMALGDHEGQVNFYVNGRDPNASLSAVAPGKYFMWKDKPKPVMKEHHVPMTTIDQFCAKHPFDVGLIKLDVEGAELPVLRGAEKTLKRYRPILILETHAFAWESFGYTREDLERFIQESGYTLFNQFGELFTGALGTGPERDNNHYIVRPK